MPRTSSPHLTHATKPVEWGLCLSKGGAHKGTVKILAPGAPSINTFSFLNVHALRQSCALGLRPRWPLVLPVTLGKAGVGFLQTQWSFLLQALQAYFLRHIVLPWTSSVSLPDQLRGEWRPRDCSMFGGTLEHSPPQLDSKARVPYLFSSRSLINTWPSSGEFCSFREWSSDLLIKKKKKK